MKKRIIFLLMGAFVMLFALISCVDTEDSPHSKTYIIQYADQSGNHQIFVHSGEVYSLESIPQKTGYEFLGLFDMEEGGVQYVSKTGTSIVPFADNVNLTLYPQFKAKSYTLVLDYQGADVTGLRQMEVAYGSAVAGLPMNLALNHKSFAGWYTEPNCGGTQVADKFGVLPDKSLVNEAVYDLSNPNGFIYLYAGFKAQEFKVSLYIGNNTVPEELMVEWGTPISAIPCDTRVNGMAVLSWSKARNDTQGANIFTGKIDSDMVLYSCELAPILEFEENGAEDVSDIIAKAGSAIVLPKPIKPSFDFLGWFDTNGVQFTDSQMPKQSIKLFAKWKAVTITFDENGGEAVDDISVSSGSPVTLPIINRDGYLFAGWYDKSGQIYNTTVMPESSVELKAGWYKANTQTFYLIQSNGEKKFDNTTITYSNLSINLDTLREICGDANIKIDFNVKYKYDPAGHTAVYPQTIKISLFNNSVLSGNNLISSETLSSEENKYKNFAFTINHSLDTPFIYVATTCSKYEGWHYLSDFYATVYYPDTSVLY